MPKVKFSLEENPLSLSLGLVLMDLEREENKGR